MVFIKDELIYSVLAAQEAFDSETILRAKIELNRDKNDGYISSTFSSSCDNIILSRGRARNHQDRASKSRWLAQDKQILRWDIISFLLLQVIKNEFHNYLSNKCYLSPQLFINIRQEGDYFLSLSLSWLVTFFLLLLCSCLYRNRSDLVLQLCGHPSKALYSGWAEETYSNLQQPTRLYYNTNATKKKKLKYHQQRQINKWQAVF
jgi:hypothetical protein